MSSVPREFMLAVPGRVVDIYALHQMVWSQVSQIYRKEKNNSCPLIDVNFLYRRDVGRVIVRCCDLKKAGHQNPLPFLSDAVRDVKICIAPFRDKFSSELHDVDLVILKLFSESGLKVLSHQIIEHGLATGVKIINGKKHKITLPFFEIRASISVSDKELAEKGWVDGIGRGKRFGFGMPILA